MDRCPGCGFAYDMALGPGAGRAIVEHADGIADLLTGPPAGAALTNRPKGEPETWSPLEYACHVRDVLLVQRERVLLARRVEGTGFAQMGRDERVEHDGYATQDPRDVARQLRDAARLFANVLDRLEPADWTRKVVYSYPEPTERDLTWMAVHTQHEMVHHLQDIQNQLVTKE